MSEAVVHLSTLLVIAHPCQAAHIPLQPHYGYGYVGLDWPEEYATCLGSRQSPIHIPGHTRE